MWGAISSWFWFVLPCMSDVEHLFMCLLALCISSSEKCLIQVLWLFFNGLFLLLSSRSSLHILYINPLSDTWFATILWARCFEWLGTAISVPLVTPCVTTSGCLLSCLFSAEITTTLHFSLFLFLCLLKDIFVTYVCYIHTYIIWKIYCFILSYIKISFRV